MPEARFYYRNEDAPAPQKIGVGALALIEADGSLLLELRSDCCRWGLPGGAVEPDEDIEVALHREVTEETSLTVSSHELFGIYTDESRIVVYPDGNVVRLISFVYLCSVSETFDIRRSSESLELRVFDASEIPHLDVVETARPILDDYLRA